MRLSHPRSLCALLLSVLFLSACGAAPPSEPAPKDIPAPSDVAAPPAGSLKTTSGLSTLVLQPGTGTRRPRATDRVRVHYTGWTTDGKMFDSSVARNQPSEFAVNEVIPGWTEALQMMVEGEKRRLWIPARLAYEGSPSRPQGMLVFEVELIRIL
jgi:peptidylprolyl isomerase